MIKHDQVSDADLHYKIRAGKIYFAGNRTLKIYGTLYCPSGKRMTRINRGYSSYRKKRLLQTGIAHAGIV